MRPPPAHSKPPQVGPRPAGSRAAVLRLESGLADPVIKTKKKVFPGGAGPGRPKGLGNKSTGRAREAIARFVDGNAERLEGWLDEIAENDGPMAAFKCFADVLEYHVPKLARTELTGADQGPVELVVKWRSPEK